MRKIVATHFSGGYDPVWKWMLPTRSATWTDSRPSCQKFHCRSHPDPAAADAPPAFREPSRFCASSKAPPQERRHDHLSGSLPRARRCPHEQPPRPAPSAGCDR
ncbi:hypothetical protein FTUN_5004 [Frigoriglobus tundricola]|uniref:Uncharacterized protein n=1 Tax=Frigoriglobus tundricola TaxID=2774151 RepID=A0A6M5YVB2_9BACT|nr:hypothetical protein FTUN_5004 [Frigoriglobus tundricola]